VINYGKQTIDTSDIKTVTKILKSNFLTQGPMIELFQNKIQNFFGSKYCTVVSNGTAGLYLAGKALKWKKGDKIITSPITFIASANAIVLSGAQPILVDIDAKTYNLDPNKVEDKIKKSKKNIKAVIGVDYAGYPCDWESLKYLSNKYNFRLINDNCHALGAKIKNDRKYAPNYADVVVQSYHPVKNITTGEGGAILTNDPVLNKKFLELRNHSMIKKKSFLPWEYRVYQPGLNFRLTDIQCALGISQIAKLSNFTDKRNTISKIYSSSFKNNSNLKIPAVEKNYYHAFHLYPLLINFKKTKINKKSFFLAMRRRGINLQVHYVPLHYQPLFRKICRMKKGDLPISEDFYNKEVSFPIYPTLSLTNIKKIIKDTLSLI
tara:strand:- start:890 stop:2023 length:1134 start_codon:yes stop_codon:yes gene_type:complete